ncbi:MAG: hypothetical protein ACLU99_14710 [Alphaproteobacteria bacterium]
MKARTLLKDREIIEKWLGDGLITLNWLKIVGNQTNLSADEVITMIAKMFKASTSGILKAENCNWYMPSLTALTDISTTSSSRRL